MLDLKIQSRIIESVLRDNCRYHFYQNADSKVAYFINDENFERVLIHTSNPSRTAFIGYFPFMKFNKIYLLKDNYRIDRWNGNNKGGSIIEEIIKQPNIKPEKFNSDGISISIGLTNHNPRDTLIAACELYVDWINKFDKLSDILKYHSPYTRL